jgi:hypothetical protein
MDNYETLTKKFIEENCLDLNSYEYNKLIILKPELISAFEEKWLKVKNKEEYYGPNSETYGVRNNRTYNSNITLSFDLSKGVNCRDLYSLKIYFVEHKKVFRNIFAYTFSDLNERNTFGQFLPGTLSNALAYFVYPELVSIIKKEKVDLDMLISKYFLDYAEEAELEKDEEEEEK